MDIKDLEKYIPDGPGLSEEEFERLAKPRVLKIKKLSKEESQEQLKKYLDNMEKRENFVKRMYEHLKSEFKSGESVYVPSGNKEDLMYPGIKDSIYAHEKERGFDFHKFFKAGHVASSQAACFNLFMPIMKSGHAAEILSAVKPDIDRIDTEELDHGFCFEYWREDPLNDESRGLLNDHSKTAGTDADFALRYIDKDGKRCLWLIEHKLTEREFTQCNVIHNGKHPDELEHCVSYTPEQLMSDPQKCYYTRVRHFDYWEKTKEFGCFPGMDVKKAGCPFKDGMCQLWRNVLLAKAAREAYGYDKVYFSVLKPQANAALDASIKSFKAIVEPGLFSVITPAALVEATARFDDDFTRDWVEWYKRVYLDF